MQLQEKYHLPHNSIRIDEFYFMLESLDLSKKYYIYEDLRMLFLTKQIMLDKLKEFHPAYHRNLVNHTNENIIKLYEKAKANPSQQNLSNLLNCQYTPRKTFKQVFNETVRDYTEFFAFLGLLPTYYKGKKGGEKKHYVTNRLKLFLTHDLSLEDILFDFKYRNSSKDYDSITMYQISVRPFIVAMNACKKYFDLGYEKIHNKIISAIVLYAKDENIDKFINMFNDPQKDISHYKKFFVGNFNSINDELGRATLFLRPYLIYLGYLDRDGKYYIKGKKKISDDIAPNRAVFCNSHLNNITLTPVVGKVLYTLNKIAKKNKYSCDISELFDHNIAKEDKDFLIDELIKLGCIISFSEDKVFINKLKYQFAINPYTDFFDIDDANYVESIGDISINAEEFIVDEHNMKITSILESIKPIALGSDGEKYEQVFYDLLQDNFNVFDVKWLGANAVGKRLSDILIRVKVFDGSKTSTLAIIIECKAGKAIRTFDERKEIDDLVNTLKKEKGPIDGIWYWIVNGDALPNIDSHGGYRVNEYSKSFMEKLSDIQFSVSEYMRVPTIVTAFSFDSISNYISYLYDLTYKFDYDTLNKIDVPHFWRWSKKFMNLQYVMVHKELKLDL